MLLYFLRHAEAEDHGIRASDFERELTKKGQRQAEKMGGFCAALKTPPELILSSPVLRAKQTAETVAASFDTVEMLLCQWLACGMNPEVCAEELSAYKQFSSVLLVGHEPDFSLAIAYFVGLSAENLRIRKASLTALNSHSLQPTSAQIQFLLPVQVL
ncbi:MAG: phosphohistidine phosphatase SixA [Chthoniobacterales bacterium]